MKVSLSLFILLFSFSIVHAQRDSGYFASFDGTRIYYEVNGSGYPIVLVHGFIVNGDWWKKIPLYEVLLKSGYKLISFDMRGNGRSDKPHDSTAYANDAEAKDIMRLLDRLKIDRYIPVGYSRGSIITARLLVLDKRVQAAALGGMGDGFTDPEWPRRKMFYRALSGEPVKELEGMVNYVKQSGLDQQALAYLQKEQPSVIPEVLAKIRVPVLIINGDKDPDNGSPEALSKFIPTSSLTIIPGDHGTMPRSSAYADAVEEFIKKQTLKK